MAEHQQEVRIDHTGPCREVGNGDIQNIERSAATAARIRQRLPTIEHDTVDPARQQRIDRRRLGREWRLHAGYRDTERRQDRAAAAIGTVLQALQTFLKIIPVANVFALL